MKNSWYIARLVDERNSTYTAQRAKTQQQGQAEMREGDMEFNVYFSVQEAGASAATIGLQTTLGSLVTGWALVCVFCDQMNSGRRHPLVTQG